MMFYVSMAVDGRITLEVEASSFEDAKDKANIAFCEADFNMLECIDAVAVNAEDECGNFVDY